MTNKTLIVIGGGAAGFFCAVNAARLNPNLTVIILEKSAKILSKVKISGGGRCNVTHACFSRSALQKNYPRGGNFLKKIFQQFYTEDTIEWFKSRNVPLKVEADGRMFPFTNNSQTIIDCLLKEANNNKVEIRFNAGVEKITTSENGFILHVSGDRKLNADFICIASGGYPKSAQFNWLTEIGHSIEVPVPSLFTFNIPKNPITELMGISVQDAIVKIQGTKLQQQGPLLITHWGLSGPAILKTSAWAARVLEAQQYDFTTIINWLPQFNEQTLIEHLRSIRFDVASKKMGQKNPFELPARLWEYFLQQTEINPEIRWADLPAKEQNKLAKILCNQTFAVKGKTTFKEEFVTAGGIVLDEIDANTLQSRIIPHLFFAGEVINVDGVTGGFNFQNAWTTGWIAAKAIANLSA